MTNDADLYFQKWEDILSELDARLRDAVEAEVNYDSVLASEISRHLSSDGAVSTAERMARGTEAVQQAKKRRLNAQNVVDASREKIKFLEGRINWIKLKYRAEKSITGA